MSTKKESKTTQKNEYNPAAMSAYNAFQPAIMNALLPYLTGNPLQSPFFQLMHGAGQKQANQLAQRGRGNIFANAAQGGLTQPGLQSLLAKQGRFGSSLNANAFQNAAQQAFAMQQWATQLAQGYQPLQTGQNQTQTQKTSGLGTWLPQAIGMGLNFAMPFMGAGLLGGAKASAGQGTSGFSGLQNITGGQGTTFASPFQQNFSGAFFNPSMSAPTSNLWNPASQNTSGWFVPPPGTR